MKDGNASEGPINPDREQQRRDNVVSREQSGLEPMPRDRDEEQADGGGEGGEAAGGAEGERGEGTASSRGADRG